MSKESTDSCPRLKLTDINPFTPRQREIINLLIAGKQYKEIALILGNAYDTVKSIIYNPNGSSIFSRVESLTGEWPGSRYRLIAILNGDVIILRSDGDGIEKLITR